MSDTLFREAAVTHQGERLWGELIVSQPLPIRIITLFLAVLTLTAVIWLGFNSYQRKVSVSGQLVPDGGVLEIPAPANAVVVELLAKLDQHVDAGTPLFVMEIDHTLHSERPITTGVIQSLQQQERALAEEMALERRNIQLADQHFADSLPLALATTAQWQQAQNEQRELLEIRRRQHDRGHRLQLQGVLAVADAEALEVQLLLQQQSAGQAAIQLKQARAAEVALRQEHESAVLRSGQQLQRLEAELQQLGQQQLRESSQQRTVVFAPVAGVVANLHLQAGMPVRQQQPVLSLVPADSTLQVEMHVPSQAIGFVKQGQAVTLRLDAFPFQKFGVQQAHVVSVSGSADFVAGDNGPPYYRVMASLRKQTLTAYGQEQRLLPGMRLTADIAVDHRTLLEWLLEPLYSLKGY